LKLTSTIHIPSFIAMVSPEGEGEGGADWDWDWDSESEVAGEEGGEGGEGGEEEGGEEGGGECERREREEEDVDDDEDEDEDDLALEETIGEMDRAPFLSSRSSISFRSSLASPASSTF